VLVAEAPMAIFFAAAIWPSRTTKRWLRAAEAAGCIVVFCAATFFAGKTFLRVCNEGDAAADLLEQFRGGGGLEGTDEYEPPQTDHWKIATDLPDACFTQDSDTVLGVIAAGESTPAWRPEQGSCEAIATAQLRQPEHIRIATSAAHPGFMILRLLSYPAWRITVNGQRVEPADMRDDGLIAIPVPQGPLQIAADWTSTPDVLAARCVSALALLLFVAVGVLERRSNRSRQA
jgi:hypothetical protein